MLKHSLMSFKKERYAGILKIYFMFSLQFLIKEVGFNLFRVMLMCKYGFVFLKSTDSHNILRTSASVLFHLGATYYNFWAP